MKKKSKEENGGVVFPERRTLVFSSWRGIPYVRTQAATVRNPRTEKQVAQRNAFKLNARCAQGMLTAARVGLHTLARGKSEYNILTQRLFAVKENLAALQLSNGTGPTVKGLAAVQDSERLRVAWTADPSYDREEDKVYVAIVTGDKTYSASGEFAQTAGEAVFTLPENVGEIAYVYAFSTDRGGRNVSATSVAEPSR